MAETPASAIKVAGEPRAVVSRLRRRFREVADVGDLPPSQTSVLSRLSKSGPATASELAAHRFIAFDPDLAMLAQWWRTTFGAREPLPGQVVCHITNLDEMQALAEAGSGITVLPDYLVKPAVEAGRLVALEPESGRRAPRRPRGTLWLVWRRAAALSARFLAVRDWMLEEGV
jgi:DNA-binding transcriptional LysR family regulator